MDGLVQSVWFDAEAICGGGDIAVAQEQGGGAVFDIERRVARQLVEGEERQGAVATRVEFEPAVRFCFGHSADAVCGRLMGSSIARRWSIGDGSLWAGRDGQVGLGRWGKIRPLTNGPPALRARSDPGIVRLRRG